MGVFAISIGSYDRTRVVKAVGSPIWAEIDGDGTKINGLKSISIRKDYRDVNI